MNNRNQRGQIVVGGLTAIVLFIAYVILAVWLGAALVNYILLSWTGSTVPGIVAVLIALFSSFNFLIPAAIITWLLNITHVLHHTIVSALPYIQNHIG